MEHQNTRAAAIGHQTVMPYLILKNAGAFIEFAKKVFSMELQSLTNRSEGVIMHAELCTQGSTVMVADATEKFKPITAGMFIYVEDTDATYKNALANGAESVMPPSDQNYGRAAGILDSWGNVWWLTSLPLPEVSN